MKVGVTGGAGFIGRHLCRELISRGNEVICIDNFLTSLRTKVSPLVGCSAFSLVEHDVRDSIPDYDVDIIFHLASPASPIDYARYPLETLQTGALGTLNVMAWAEKVDARVLLASTSEVYGDPLVSPQSERYWGNVNPVGPRAVYDESKRFAEAAVSAFNRARGLEVRIARIFNTYGPGMRSDDGRLVPTIAVQSLNNDVLTVSGTGEQTRSMCYVSDTVRGLIALAESDYEGPVNIGGDDERRVIDIVTAIRTAARSHSEIRLVSRPDDDPERRRPDLTLARDKLGWAPTVSLEDGLLRTVRYFQDEALR